MKITKKIIFISILVTVLLIFIFYLYLKKDSDKDTYNHPKYKGIVLFDIDGATTSVLGMPPNSTHMLLGEKNKIIASEPGAFFVIKNGLEQIYGF